MRANEKIVTKCNNWLQIVTKIVTKINKEIFEKVLDK
jgi:hypothetical protein